MQRLDDAGPLRPTAAGAGGQRHDGDASCRQYLTAQPGVVLRPSRGWHPTTSSGRTSSITVLAGRRFCANPMRPRFRSARMRSCCSRSKPCVLRSSARLREPVPLDAAAGSRRSNSVPTTLAPSAASDRLRRSAPVPRGGLVPVAADPGAASRGLHHVVSRRHHGRVAGEQFANRAVRIDGEIVHHRLHRERQRVLHLTFRRRAWFRRRKS